MYLLNEFFFIAVVSYCNMYSLKFKLKFQTVSVDYKPNYNNLNKLSLKPQTSEQSKNIFNSGSWFLVCMFVLLDVIEQLTKGNFIIFAIKMKNKRNLIYEDCSCHNIAEILLKVTLSTNQSFNQLWKAKNTTIELKNHRNTYTWLLTILINTPNTHIHDYLQSWSIPVRHIYMTTYNPDQYP